jgi:hypothetical protein
MARDVFVTWCERGFEPLPSSFENGKWKEFAKLSDAVEHVLNNKGLKWEEGKFLPWLRAGSHTDGSHLFNIAGILILADAINEAVPGTFPSR